MDPIAIVGLITEGLSLLPSIIKAGGDVITTIKMLEGLGQSAKDGTVTDAQVQDVRSHLDELIDRFNEELPADIK